MEPFNAVMNLMTRAILGFWHGGCLWLKCYFMLY